MPSLRSRCATAKPMPLHRPTPVTIATLAASASMPALLSHRPARGRIPGRAQRPLTDLIEPVDFQLAQSSSGGATLRPLSRHDTLSRVVIPELPDAFDITESVEPDGVRLSICGELDVAVIDRLRDRLDSVARAGETVVLDLSELSFIDSSGLNVIVTAFRQAKRDGWVLRIEQSMRRPVQRVVAMMGLDAVFWSAPEPLDH